MENDLQDIKDDLQEIADTALSLKARVDAIMKRINNAESKINCDVDSYPPLFFYDLETTGRGKTINLRITQIGCIALVNGKEHEFNRYVNPSAHTEDKKTEKSDDKDTRDAKGVLSSSSSESDGEDDKNNNDNSDDVDSIDVSDNEEDDQNKNNVTVEDNEDEQFMRYLESDLSKVNISISSRPTQTTTTTTNTKKLETIKPIILPAPTRSSSTTTPLKATTTTPTPSALSDSRTSIYKTLKYAPFSQVGKEFIKFITEVTGGYKGKIYLLAHNGKSYDSRIILSECEMSELELPTNVMFVDTIEVFKFVIVSGLRKHTPKKMTLDSLYQMFTRKKYESHHNALDDSRAMLQITNAMIREDNLNITMSSFFEQYIRPKAETIGKASNRMHGKK